MPTAYGLRPPASASCLGAALASCRPLPQQFLPVSATGSGRRCCTLGIFSGKFIFDIARQPDLRVWLFCFFMGRAVAAGGICWRLFPSETAAQLGRNLSGVLRQLPRRGELFFHLTVTKLSLRGSWHCAAMTERVTRDSILLYQA